MTLQTVIDAVRQLTPQEREELMAMLSDLSHEGDAGELTDAQKAELIRRRNANRANPSRLVPRETVSARMKERRKP